MSPFKEKMVGSALDKLTHNFKRTNKMDHKLEGIRGTNVATETAAEAHGEVRVCLGYLGVDANHVRCKPMIGQPRIHSRKETNCSG